MSDEEVEAAYVHHAGMIHAAQAAMSRQLLHAARHMFSVQGKLDEPAFERWAFDNFGWGAESARLLAVIGERFAPQTGEAIDLFQPGALFLLADPHATEAAARSISLARKGTRITCAIASRLLAGEDVGNGEGE